MAETKQGELFMDELVEILNEDGKKVGDTISKFKAHQEGICHGISGITLIDDKGRLLIQRRGEGCGDEDVSAAGHIEINETPEKAAAREFYEEMGIEVNEKEIQLIDTYLNKVKLDNGIQLNHFTYLFIVKKNINNEKVVVEKREVSETKFVNKEELIRMLENDEMVSAMGHCSKVLDYMK